MSRAAIEELLRAGHSDRAIARQVQVRNTRVGAIRAQLGLSTHKPGPTRAATPEDYFWRHAQPTDDGHLLWPHAYMSFRTGHEGRKQSARHVAFRIGWRREPVGRVTAGCEYPGCVHPRCVEDQPMREQLDDQIAAIFGRTL